MRQTGKHPLPSKFAGNDGASEFLLAQGTIIPFSGQLCISVNLDAMAGLERKSNISQTHYSNKFRAEYEYLKLSISLLYAS